MALLFYWRDYAENTRNGPIYKLNQRNPLIAELIAGETVWAIALEGPGHYILAAEFKVARAGRNLVSDPDRDRYGMHFFEADPGASRYFAASPQDSVEPLIRNLSIKVEAEHLGKAFEGANGVRPLTDDDCALLSRHAAGLALDQRLSQPYIDNSTMG